MPSIAQADWGGGIFRGRNAPADSVYDALNALVNDERELYRRGGTAYLGSAVAGAVLLGLVDTTLLAGARTFAWDTTFLRVLSADETTWLGSQFIATPGARGPQPFGRPAVIGGLVVIPVRGGIAVYGGSYKVGAVGSGTVTNGSRTVTGSGTSWTTTADAGVVLIDEKSTSGTTTGVVASVDSNTQLTLVDPWPGRTILTSAYVLRALDLTAAFRGFSATMYPAMLAAAGRRLLVGVNDRVLVSDIDQPADFTTNVANDQYHVIPGGQILGGEGLGTTAVVFTTNGVWTISNLDLDFVDPAGNIQQAVTQVSKDIILWSNAGIAGWQDRLLVPAVDDVYLFGLDAAPVPLSAAIRPLYRGYVKAGYQAGLASVHRGHYFLPILDGSNALVDVLVCRLDAGAAWTRLSGHAGCTSFAVRMGTTTRQPRLIGANGTRLVELTDAFTVPGAAQDADGSTPTVQIDTQDYDTSPGLRPAYVDRVRVEYEAAGTTPAVAVGWAAGSEGAAFTTLTAARGGGASDGTDYSAWPVRKKRERIRFRISSTSALTKFILRRLEVLTRQDGRT